MSKYWNHAGKNAQKFAKKIAQEKKSRNRVPNIKIRPQEHKLISRMLKVSKRTSGLKSSRRTKTYSSWEGQTWT